MALHRVLLVVLFPYWWGLLTLPGVSNCSSPYSDCVATYCHPSLFPAGKDRTSHQYFIICSAHWKLLSVLCPHTGSTGWQTPLFLLPIGKWPVLPTCTPGMYLCPSFSHYHSLHPDDAGSMVLQNVILPQHHNPEDLDLNLHCCENLKSLIRAGVIHVSVQCSYVGYSRNLFYVVIVLLWTHVSFYE
jgi:hypothetical protein